MKDVSWGKCAVIGGAAGLANGLFGAGGGMVVVPLLIGWLDMDEREAFATSLLIILPMSVVSLSFKLWQTGAPELSFAPYIVGGIAGGILAGRWFRKLKLKWLHRRFGALILYGGIKAVMGW